MKKLIGSFARFLLGPWLLYWAQFRSIAGVVVAANTIDAGPLMYATSSRVNGMQRLLGATNPIGLTLAVSLPRIDNHIVMVALSPIPTGLPPRFTLVAEFELPPWIGPTNGGVQWAATLGIRNGDDLSDPDWTMANASHQVRHFVDTDPDPDHHPDPDTGRIGLSVGNGATQGTYPSKPNFVIPTEAYPDGRRQFTLEVDIFREESKGWSRLRTPGKVWSDLSWQFKKASDYTVGNGIGFGMAFVQGEGIAEATALSFRIYRYIPRLRWVRAVLFRYASYASR